MAAVGLKLDDVGSLMSAGTFHDIELNVLTFVKGLEAFTLDGGKMYEYVFAIFTFDETKALFSVKPFYFAVHEKPPKDFIGGVIIA